MDLRSVQREPGMEHFVELPSRDRAAVVAIDAKIEATPAQPAACTG
jgi:hypothetical protein